jgi:Uma2 family endonuclease
VRAAPLQLRWTDRERISRCIGGVVDIRRRREMQVPERVRVSDEEYLARERRAETKHELIAGEIVAMAGAAPKHNALALNVGAALRQRFRERRSTCIAFSSDQRVHIESTGLFTYPDLSVACGGAHFHPKDRNTLINPKVIVEVLSSSTEAYDRGAKFTQYRSIPSLAEYVMVSQHERRIEHYRRLETGQWLLTVHQGDEAVLVLPALGCEIPLAEIYDQTDELDAEPDEAAPPSG